MKPELGRDANAAHGTVAPAETRKPATPRYDGPTHDLAVKFRTALGGDATINVSD